MPSKYIQSFTRPERPDFSNFCLLYFFGEISLKPSSDHIVHLRQCDQIWQNFAALVKYSKSWAIFEGLFTIRQNFGPTYQILYAIGQIFVGVKGPMLKTNLAIWSHC